MSVTRARAKYKPTILSGASTVTNSTTETNHPFELLIKANALKVGKTYRVTARGVLSSAATGSNGLDCRIKLNSTTLCRSGSPNVINAVTNKGYLVQADIIVLTVGVAGAVEAQGFETVATASDQARSRDMENAAPVAIDTTIDQTLRLSNQWNVADAGNSVTVRAVIVEELG